MIELERPKAFATIQEWIDYCDQLESERDKLKEELQTLKEEVKNNIKIAFESIDKLKELIK